MHKDVHRFTLYHLGQHRLKQLVKLQRWSVASMQPEQLKTALAFHAKDDLPEVRRDVFSLLSQHDVRFYAVVRDKRVIVDNVLDHNKKKTPTRHGAEFHPPAVNIVGFGGGSSYATNRKGVRTKKPTR